MDMQPITDSSMLSAHGFENGELHLTFAKGSNTYAYPCTDTQYSEFQAAESKGSWFHANIRANKVEGRKVETES